MGIFKPFHEVNTHNVFVGCAFASPNLADCYDNLMFKTQLQ